MQRQLNPSSVHLLVGDACRAFDDAMRRGDLEEASNSLGTVRKYARVFDPDEVRSIDELPGFAVGDKRSSSQVKRDMEDRHGDYLRILRRAAGVFAAPPEEWGDSSTLEEPIPDEAPT